MSLTLAKFFDSFLDLVRLAGPPVIGGGASAGEGILMGLK